MANTMDKQDKPNAKDAKDLKDPEDLRKPLLDGRDVFPAKQELQGRRNFSDQRGENSDPVSANRVKSLPRSSSLPVWTWKKSATDIALHTLKEPYTHILYTFYS